MSTGKTAIQSQSDYLTYLYNSPRNLVVGNLSLNPLTSSTLQLTNYFPGTNYAICGFFQSSDPNKTLTTQLNCTVVTTLTNETDDIYTATAKFKSKPTYNDRQTILCYLQGQLNNPTSTAFISNSYGERCLPMAALYKYNGTQNSELFDIYYLVTNDTSSATTAAKANFTGLFSGNELGLTSLNTVNGKLPSGIILDSFTLNSTTPTAYSTIIGDSTFVPPTGSAMTDPNTIPIVFPASAFVGSVYMGIYVTNSSNSAPSPENVTNCKLGSGSVSLQYCQRIMLNNPVTCLSNAESSNCFDCCRWGQQFLYLQSILDSSKQVSLSPLPIFISNNLKLSITSHGIDYLRQQQQLPRSSWKICHKYCCNKHCSCC